MNRHSSSLPSIAVSALVKPSRMLSWALVLYCLALLLVAAVIVLSLLGDSPLFIRILVACVTLLAIGIALHWLIWRRKIIRLDISMNGQIRLVEHNGLTDSSLLCQGEADGNPVLRLMPDSVLWPGLLLLRLENEQRHVVVLPILRDSMNAEAFHALSVACRWIAAQNNPANGELS